MKKYILALAVLAFGYTFADAQNLFVDEVVEAPQGGMAKVAIKYQTGGYDLKALQFKFELPEGITVGENSDKKSYDVADAKASDFSVTYYNNGWNAFSASSAFSADSEGNGTFMYVYLAIDPSLGLNSTHTVKVTGPMVSRVVDGTSEAYYIDDFEFTIKVVDYVTLDEESAELPMAAENIKAKVNRTLSANKWSTVCFPFAMTQEQCNEVFGSDAQIASLENWLITDYDEESLEIYSITVNFKNLTAIQKKKGLETGKPYLIKTTKDVNGFELEGVTISLDKSDVQVTETGDWEETLKLVGTFNKTKVPAKRMFLSDNKFYYSKGSTAIKGFRAWFDFGDNVLAAYEDGGSVKMQVNVDGEPTRVDDLLIVTAPEGVFTVDGKKMNNDVTKLPKGVYIIDGKKVAIK